MRDTTKEKNMAGEHAKLDPALQELIDSPDWRVLYQYFNPTDSGPQFKFTTVRATSAAEAQSTFEQTGEFTQARNAAVVQVIEANDFITGYTRDDVIAQLTHEETEFVRRRSFAESEFWMNEKEIRDAATASNSGSDDTHL
jgi:hypothetical protein